MKKKFDKLNPEKSMPKRMGSERPNKNKLRKVPKIKNSFSLRIKKDIRKQHNSKNSRISESENDFSCNREYSEEQGRRALYLASSN